MRQLPTVAFGTAGYNSQRGPGATNLDASVFRNFHIYEGLNVQFRAEAFNVTNTPHFGNPGNNIAAVSYNPDDSIASFEWIQSDNKPHPAGPPHRSAVHAFRCSIQLLI
jgi:hypothetical protein